MIRPRFVSLVVLVLVFVAAAAVAQTTVTLPDTSQSTTLTANVSDQAQVTVPPSVTFNVTNISGSTAASAASVTASNIVLAGASNHLRISVQANAASFTPSVVTGVTWAAGDVTWNAATWTNATGHTGTLSNSAFNAVADCTAAVTTCSTTGLVFTIGAKPTVNYSGAHTLVVKWKFESI